MNVKHVVGLGVAVGLTGVLAQIPLMRMGVLASGSLRAMLSLLLAAGIGFVAGNFAPREGVKAASLAGVIAGTMFSLIGLGAVLMNPAVIGQSPFAAPESFFMFVSTLVMSTVIVSWLVAGIAALVALPVSLSRIAVLEEETL
jgi:hypothetical protein